VVESENPLSLEIWTRSGACYAAQARAAADVADHSVESLSKLADTVGGIVRLISDIASQTNLLALNATIEGARERSLTASGLLRIAGGHFPLLERASARGHGAGLGWIRDGLRNAARPRMKEARVSDATLRAAPAAG
jgi:hypothetical protein